MNRPDPYADLGEVYASEVSRERIRVKPTPKTPTDAEGEETASEVWADIPRADAFGMHIDGDRRYQER